LFSSLIKRIILKRSSVEANFSRLTVDIVKSGQSRRGLGIILSVEFPEAHILSQQMDRELTGKQVTVYTLQHYTKLQNLGFINMYLSDFERLCSRTVETVISRGNVIQVKFSDAMNLILAPEYGGIILFHKKEHPISEKFHLKLGFTDQTALTVTLTGMGIIHALADSELSHSYVYQRDFSQTASPMDENFTLDSFSKALLGKNVNLKTMLVGKDAVVTGLGNSTFQDVTYRAGIHPKRKASELTEAQRRKLYDAIRLVIEQRLQLGGKIQFIDFYGRRGGYEPAMGSGMAGKICKVCGAEVVKLNLSGGQCCICPGCQK
jgi:formamidopyrimidine-DNA glycosylase